MEGKQSALDEMNQKKTKQELKIGELEGIVGELERQTDVGKSELEEWREKFYNAESEARQAEEEVRQLGFKIGELDNKLQYTLMDYEQINKALYDKN